MVPHHVVWYCLFNRERIGKRTADLFAVKISQSKNPQRKEHFVSNISAQSKMTAQWSDQAACKL